MSSSGQTSGQRRPWVLPLCPLVSAALLAFTATTFFLIPGGLVIGALDDPGLRTGAIPKLAWRLHADLSPHYERWARERVASRRATGLDIANISGTEWPLFGSVFYLWATESLQAAWSRDRTLAARPPRDYARGAIEAAAALVVDPHHAAWVRRHWGDAYLERENVAYRMFLIAALTSRERLLGQSEQRALLRRQVESLARELDASPHGQLDDYPGECYPGDVLMAVASIRRADAVLGTDHSALARRALRGFEGALVDQRGLPPYAADARSGKANGPSRGCSNAYAALSAPELWPAQARRWYAAHERYFWQRRWAAVGFREFPRDLPGHDWYMDVDAGPVVAGFGFAASAFGVGAARLHGRLDQAYPMTAQMIPLLWPLPDGTLAGPRLLSDATDAPLLGEAAILYILTRQPLPGWLVRTGGERTDFVAIMLGLYFGIGGLLLRAAWRRGRRWWRGRGRGVSFPAPRLQLALWLALLGSGGLAFALGRPGLGVVSCLLALTLPRESRPRQPRQR